MSAIARRRSFGVGTVGPFSPSSVAGLKGWWAADVGTSSIVDGTALSAWNDQSGLAHHLVQATGGNQPVYKTAIQNGKPVVRFSSTRYMAAAFAFSPPEEIFLVFRASGALLGGDSVLDGHASGGGENTMLYQRTGAATMLLYAGNAGPSLSVDPTVWHVHNMQYNGASSKAAADGGTFATGDAGASGGGGVTLAARANGDNLLACDIGECLAYSPIVSAPNRALILNYLKVRWGTP